jgi:hypothetical protein
MHGEASQVRNGWDDERLLTALSEAMKARAAVPAWFIETGKNAFAWHNIDAELAQLTYDSNEDRREAAVTRAETASIRSLTFTSEHLTMELEVTGNSLLGQIFPTRAGVLEIHTRAGEISTTEVDEIGCFSVEPIPASPFRLRSSAFDGTYVLTGWITILAVRVSRQDFPSAGVSNRAVCPSVEMSEPVGAGGTHGLGFLLPGRGRGVGGARVPRAYFPAAMCCLTVASMDAQGSQPSCDHRILPEAETRANHGWSCTW